MVKINNDSRATIRTSMGDIVLEFLNDKAPNTVENFVKLANKGFYDGLTFHRVIKGFMIQGGCPKGNGSGNPGYTIRPEFNDTPHVTGTVSMARSNDPHSAGSQFFICQGEARYLDSRYTAFARVAEGQDVVEKIASVPVNMETRYQEISVPRSPIYINTVKVDGVEFDDPPPQQRNTNEQGDGAGNAPEAGKDEATGGGGRSRGRGRGRGRGRDRGARSDTGGDAGGNTGRDSAGDAKASDDKASNNNRAPEAASSDRKDDGGKQPAAEAADAPAKKPARKASRAKAKTADKPAAAGGKAKAAKSTKAAKASKTAKATKADDKPKPRAKKATAKKTTRKAAKKTTRSKGKD